MCGQCHLPRRLHRAPRARRGGPACPAAAGRWVCRRDSWGRLPVAYSEASEAAACTCACRWWREARKGDRQRRGAQACARVREHRQGAESALDESTPRSRGLGGITQSRPSRRHSRRHAPVLSPLAAPLLPVSPALHVVLRACSLRAREVGREREGDGSLGCACACACACASCASCACAVHARVHARVRARVRLHRCTFTIP